MPNKFNISACSKLTVNQQIFKCDADGLLFSFLFFFIVFRSTSPWLMVDQEQLIFLTVKLCRSEDGISSVCHPEASCLKHG